MQIRQILNTRSRGLTLLEVLIAVVIIGIIFVALNGLVQQALMTQDISSERNKLTQQARFAMQRMVYAINNAQELILPLADDATTAFRENVREQTEPSSPPESGSSLATAVLAVSLHGNSDQNSDGISDADDDNDGRIDEDLPADRSNDASPGLYLVDDDGDGDVDEDPTTPDDDDEQNAVADEDPVNNIDDDNDGTVDEDSGSDMNADGCPGICGVDDDNDGLIDEGDIGDDDEDGLVDEDWINPLVYFLQKGRLQERLPVPWDVNSDGRVDGRDFVESTLAEQVTLFRVERLDSAGRRKQLISIQLKLQDSAGRSIGFSTQVRLNVGLQ